jgi:hypothetical protein
MNGEEVYVRRFHVMHNAAPLPTTVGENACSHIDSMILMFYEG